LRGVTRGGFLRLFRFVLALLHTLLIGGGLRRLFLAEASGLGRVGAGHIDRNFLGGGRQRPIRIGDMSLCVDGPVHGVGLDFGRQADEADEEQGAQAFHGDSSARPAALGTIVNKVSTADKPRAPA